MIFAIKFRTYAVQITHKLQRRIIPLRRVQRSNLALEIRDVLFRVCGGQTVQSLQSLGRVRGGRGGGNGDWGRILCRCGGEAREGQKWARVGARPGPGWCGAGPKAEVAEGEDDTRSLKAGEFCAPALRWSVCCTSSAYDETRP